MPMDEPQHRLTVVGGGVMGSSIAALALGHGIPVTLVDLTEDVLRVTRENVDRQLRHAQLLGALPEGCAPAELVTTTSPAAAAEATAVIEAVVEFSGTKAKVLAEFAALTGPGVPLITNTSGIPVDELAEAVPHPEDLVGTHFMNPPFLIKAVEVIRGPRTGERTLARVGSLLTALGRTAIEVRDAPGFVTSRLLHPMINDAARVVEAGTATVEAVDELMRKCLGHPTGPLATADLIGIDNLVDSLNILFERTQDPGCRPCELLLEKVRSGDLGRKSGRGFYDYGKASM
ncbi:3-hydroxyacyl-CoA dehydrogenase family protein [Streptomyces sp. enrichment culture]|uniref:3-hydroxyacyl-CoA dehydrogenase family protein n=1 Tax=Streptomyces sp. enrichment culture TaxID=1795815 RepID=UPI003F543666